MTVKQLINELLNYPMDTEVIPVVKNEEENYVYGNGVIIVDYEDGTLGLLGTKEVKK